MPFKYSTWKYSIPILRNIMYEQRRMSDLQTILHRKRKMRLWIWTYLVMGTLFSVT